MKKMLNLRNEIWFDFGNIFGNEGRVRATAASVIVFLVLFFLVSISAAAAQAQTYSVMYNFPSLGNGANPTNPGVIAQGRDGNLYSTTLSGCGPYNLFGPVFKISPAAKFKVVACLYNTAYNTLGGPYSGVTLGTDGNFYGTTYGGDYSGAVIKVSAAGKLTVYDVFGASPNIASPFAPPVLGMDGSFHGTADDHGSSGCTYGYGGCGGIYKIKSTGKSYLVPKLFEQTDGANSVTPLLLGSDGNFYGTTSEGGSSFSRDYGGGGVIFKITASGTYDVLYNLCSLTGCLDGADPLDGLVQGADGDFYGTASDGGTRTYAGSSPGGVVFKVSSTGSYSVLYNFCSQPSCTDGNIPYGGLVQASDGNFYGTTQVGGAHNDGVIFQLTPAGTFAVLYSFDGMHGQYPEGTLIQHTNGILYGDTYNGGSSNDGVFFSLNMGLPTFAKLVTWWGKPGGVVGILGQGFKTATSVSFNGVPATTFKASGDTYISATVPVGATSGKVTVVTASGTLTSSREFVVQ